MEVTARRRRRVVSVFAVRAFAMLAALTAAMAVAPAAQATFPGANGTIAFTSERSGNPEIYSGSQTRLTTHAADDRSPAWNVSGAELAFASNRDGAGVGDFEIYRMPAAGSATPAQLTDNAVFDGSPAWAPDDTRLVIVREAAGGDTDLVILAADGTGATTPLTASAAVSGEVEPNWAPNGSRIVFSAFAPGAVQRDIFTILPDGTGLTNLTNSPNLDDREPNWSPRNARITYSSFLDSNYDIHIMNADGTGDSNITNDPGAEDRDPAWSPDATRIAFTSRDAFGSESIINIASTGVYPVKWASGREPDWQRVPPAACGDGLDNDGDGQIDYPNDQGCGSTSDNDETNPACNDGIDNDGDAKIDYPDDLGCTWGGDNDETNLACNDGIDNDGDSYIDYPADPGCTSSTFDNDEFNIECSDNADNDGDGQIDYPDDPGCTSTSDTDETNPACNDGIDNDGDGKIDYPDDVGCDRLADDNETNGACSDGIDNDGDTLIDYPDDPGCSSAMDNNEFNTVCNDRLDNDGDTLIDYPNDPGCTSPIDTDETNPLCNDGVDNDGDTRIDYPNDPGCTSASDNDERQLNASERPRSAPRIRVSLVPAYKPCLTANREHGPPLAFPSCNPPVQRSAAVTVGTDEANGAANNSEGALALTAHPGFPGPPEDSDMIVTGSITDVRCLPSTTTPCGNANAVDGPDYTGELQGSGMLRITDRWNAVASGGGPDGATVVDFLFLVPFACATTDSDTIGATCTSNTSFNAVVPGAIKDGKRTVLAFNNLVVNDGGSDGLMNSGPNTQFLRQGVFVP